MSTTQRSVALAAVLLLLVAGAQAATIHFREGGGSGYTDVTFDDTEIDNYYPNDLRGGNSNAGITNNAGHRVRVLMAVKDLFTQLPATSGGADLQINSATLHLTRYNTGGNSTVVSIYQVTTDWLPDSAGNNENDVNYNDSEDSSTTRWDGGGAWSSSDYDSAIVDTSNYVDEYDEACQLDITNVITELYDDGVNYGWVIDGDASFKFRVSENSQAKRPSLEIDYTYVQRLHADGQQRDRRRQLR